MSAICAACGCPIRFGDGHQCAGPRRMVCRRREVDFGDGLVVPVFIPLYPAAPMALMPHDHRCRDGMGAIVAQEAANADPTIKAMTRCPCSAAPLARGQFVECSCGHTMPQTAIHTVPTHTRRQP